MGIYTQTFIIFLISASVSGFVSYKMRRREIARKDYNPEHNPNRLTTSDVRVDI